MTNGSPRSTRVSRVIQASRKALYHAFLDPAALVVWLPPGEMTGKIHSFDASVGGGYRMSLFYPLPSRQSGERPRTTKTVSPCV